MVLRLEQGRAVGETCALLVNHLDLFALENCDVGKLTKTIPAAMLGLPAVRVR